MYTDIKLTKETEETAHKGTVYAQATYTIKETIYEDNGTVLYEGVLENLTTNHLDELFEQYKEMTK